jgi:hypothetical protein
MMSTSPYGVYGSSDMQAVHAAAKRSLERCNRLAESVAGIIGAAMPGHNISEFKEAFTEWLSGDTALNIAEFEEQMKQPQSPASYYSAGPITADTLVSLVRRRDFIQQQLDTCEKALQPYADNCTLPEEAMASLEALMELQAAPFRSQLEDVEKEISQCQNILEKQAAGAATEAVNG